MSSPKKQIIHFGLDGPINQAQKDAGMTAEKVQAEVNSGAQKARDTGRYEVQLTFVSLETFETSLRDFRTELETGKWDAVVVGGGMKIWPQVTPQFERVISTVREAAPQTKLLFQMAPGDIHETVQRGFE